MLRYSAEARWFFDGGLPEEAVRWFHGAREPGRPAERSDTYLRLRGCASVGIKFREKNFEVKSLRAAPQPFELAPGMAGLTDTWVKWSVTSAVLPELACAIRADTPVLEVGKRRWLRNFSTAGGVPAEVEGSDAPSGGCNVELCALTLGPARAWTLAFEAYGRPEAVAQDLAATMRSVLAPPPPFALTAANSLSYPAWLDRRAG